MSSDGTPSTSAYRTPARKRTFHLCPECGASGGSGHLLTGGTSVANQYLAPGLVDEIDVSIIPVILGGGERLFEGVEPGSVQLKQIRAVDGHRDAHQVPGRRRLRQAVRRDAGGRVNVPTRSCCKGQLTKR